MEDGTIEAQEEFVFELSHPSANVKLGTVNATTISITDNEPRPSAGEIKWSDSELTVTEGEGIVKVTAVREGGVLGQVSVNYQTANVSAESGADYSFSAGTLQFDDGESSKEIELEIKSDSVSEDRESFAVFLSNAQGGAVLRRKPITVNIIDDDNASGATFSFVTDKAVATEGETIKIVVERSNHLNTAESIGVSVLDASADRADYVFDDVVVNFYNNESSKEFLLHIVDDDQPEETEELLLRLSKPAYGNEIVGDPDVQRIRILDNDPLPSGGFIGFSGGFSQVSENSGQVNLTVNRTHGSEGQAEVSYTSYAMTADEMDFETSTATILFEAGETSKQISIPILDDVVYEENEIFEVLLFEASEDSLLAINRRIIVNILDDDVPPEAGVLQFSADDYAIEENGGILILQVERTQGSTGVASVEYRTVSGGAEENEAFEASSGVLNFSDAEISKEIEIPIIDNNVVGLDKDFVVELFNVMDAVAGARMQATVTIKENDVAREDDDDSGPMQPWYLLVLLLSLFIKSRYFLKK